MINFITFLRQGPQARVFEPYLASMHTPWVDSYTEDSFETVASRVNGLANRNGRIRLLQFGTRVENIYKIDECITVKGYGEGRYEDGKKFWSFYRNITILTGCLVLAVGIGGSVAVFLHFGWVKALVTLYLVSIPPAILFSRASNAHSSMKKWDDSSLFMETGTYAETVAKNRLELIEKGWWKETPKMSSPSLNVLTPGEKAYLYQKRVKELQSNFQGISNLPDQGKSFHLRQFVEQSELGDLVRPWIIVRGLRPEFQLAGSSEIADKRRQYFQAIENGYNQVCDKLNRATNYEEVCQCLSDMQQVFDRIMAATQNGKYDLQPSG